MSDRLAYTVKHRGFDVEIRWHTDAIVNNQYITLFREGSDTEEGYNAIANTGWVDLPMYPQTREGRVYCRLDDDVSDATEFHLVYETRVTDTDDNEVIVDAGLRRVSGVYTDFYQMEDVFDWWDISDGITAWMPQIRFILLREGSTDYHDSVTIVARFNGTTHGLNRTFYGALQRT